MECRHSRCRRHQHMALTAGSSSSLMVVRLLLQYLSSSTLAMECLHHLTPSLLNPRSRTLLPTDSRRPQASNHQVYRRIYNR